VLVEEDVVLARRDGEDEWKIDGRRVYASWCIVK